MSRYLDVLGRVFSVPDPDSVAAVSASYRAVSVDIGDARSQLSALVSPQAGAEWTGQAADAFARKGGAVPGQLEQAWQSYNAAAWALSDYASQLRPVVAALGALVFEAEDAEGLLRGTVAARDQVIQQGQDPQAMGWNTRLSEAEAGVGDIERRLSALLAELDALSGECVIRIRQAQAEGIQNNAVSDFQRYVLMDGSTALADGGKAIKIVGVVLDDLLVRPFTQLASDVQHFDPHRPWESAGAVFGDLATVLGVVTLVVALAVPGLDVAALPILLGLSALATASDVTARATHEQGATWTRAGEDAFGLVSLGVGRVLGAGVIRDDNLLRNAWGHGDPSQWGDLANGTDARVSAGALWSAGIKRAFSWKDVQTTWTQEAGLTNPLHTVAADDATSWLRLGGDNDIHSPAAVFFQHVQFGLDRADNAWDVYQAQHQEGQPL